jgi:hypothetical protein
MDANMKPGENKNEQPNTQPNEFVEQKPVAYAIFGIDARGVRYLRDVKKILADDTEGEWKTDDDGLGEYWSGNQALGFIDTTATNAYLSDEPVEIPPDMSEVEYWKRRAMAARALARGFKRQAEEARAANARQSLPAADVTAQQPSSWSRRAQAAVDAVVSEKDGRKLIVLGGRMEQLLREALEVSSARNSGQQVAVAWQNTGDPTWIKVGGAAPDDSNWRALVYADNAARAAA